MGRGGLGHAPVAPAHREPPDGIRVWRVEHARGSAHVWTLGNSAYSSHPDRGGRHVIGGATPREAVEHYAQRMGWGGCAITEADEAWR